MGVRDPAVKMYGEGVRDPRVKEKGGYEMGGGDKGSGG